MDTSAPYLCCFEWNDTVNWCMVVWCINGGESQHWWSGCKLSFQHVCRFMRSLGWNPNETAETEEITEDEKREFQKLTDKVGALTVGVAVHQFCVLLFLSPLLFICFMYFQSYLPCCLSVLCILGLIFLAVHLFYVLLLLFPLPNLAYSAILSSLLNTVGGWLVCGWVVKIWKKNLDMTSSYFQRVQNITCLKNFRNWPFSGGYLCADYHSPFDSLCSKVLIWCS